MSTLNEGKHETITATLASIMDHSASQIGFTCVEDAPILTTRTMAMVILKIPTQKTVIRASFSLQKFHKQLFHILGLVLSASKLNMGLNAFWYVLSADLQVPDESKTQAHDYYIINFRSHAGSGEEGKNELAISVIISATVI